MVLQIRKQQRKKTANFDAKRGTPFWVRLAPTGREQGFPAARRAAVTLRIEKKKLAIEWTMLSYSSEVGCRFNPPHCQIPAHGTPFR
jgi:hypothetical protein